MSEGTRTLVQTTEGFIKDGVYFVEKARAFYKKLYPGKKIKFIGYGISMGAAT